MQDPEDYSHTIYQQTMTALELRQSSDEFDPQTIKAEFEALCTYQGHGMDGRNAYKDAEIQGQLDAYQVFIHRLGV